MKVSGNVGQQTSVAGKLERGGRTRGRVDRPTALLSTVAGRAKGAPVRILPAATTPIGAPGLKRPAAGSGWRRVDPPPTLPAGSEAWQRKALVAFSSLATMTAPDGSGDLLPTWLVSVSRAGAEMPSDQDLRRVRRDFGMRQAEEDNHLSGIARDLFLVVDPARRVDCECKADELVVVRPDGYRYSVPAAKNEEGK